MYTGSIPTATLLGTWVDNVEIWSIDDDTLYDLSVLTEVTLRLRDPSTKSDVMVLKMSAGQISIPSDGIIQWRAEVGQMGTLTAGIYEIVLLLEDATDTVPLIVGPVSIVE